MEGIYLGNSRGARWSVAGAVFGLASVVVAIFGGPSWVYACSGVGLVCSLVAVVLAYNSPALEKPYVFPLLLSGFHTFMFVVAGVLQLFFLTPLNPSVRKIPLLQAPYVDPSGLFELKGPVGWTIRALPSRLESGLRMQPDDKSSYMGISEITLFVRRLDTVPPSPEAFLQRAAATFSERRDGRKLFELHTEPGRSLSGAPVLFSDLTLKRFWVPIHQASVFGVKNKRYLCSVSATGVQAHSTLSRLMCLGLFERVVITDKSPS